MRVLCAPDSFKESLSGRLVARAMAMGCRDACPAGRIEVLPLADGGEGTLDVLAGALGAEIQHVPVVGPLGEQMEARLGFVARTGTAIVELAEASGLGLVPADQRDPTRTTTYGTGQLIRRAIELGCRRVLCSIGGSATVDGGAGLCQAVGASFLDRDGHALPAPLTGADLDRIARVRPPIDLPPIDVACDVTNPLCGPHGAAAVYGPQKGASAEQVSRLDAALAHYASVVGGDPSRAGAGAAGGAGHGLSAVLGARLHRGVDLVLDAVGFSQRCVGATLVLTGEGRLDGQSLDGKVVIGVARAAASHGVPTIAIVGDAGPDADRCVGALADGLLQRFVSLTERYGRQRALHETAALIGEVAAEVVRGQGLGFGASPDHA